MINEKTYIWALAGIKGIGPAGLKKLIDRFGTAQNVFKAVSARGDGIQDISESVIRRVAEVENWESIGEDLKRSIPEGANITAISEKEYPSKLKNITDPPPILYYRGDLAALDGPTLAIVGSRKPSDYGRKLAGKLSGDLASIGVSIISGLAFGIDSEAHKAALEVSGKTYAIFGCGLDYIYPPSNKQLAERIASSGALISEFPGGTKPERFNFPVRNRIISGLSDGVLVVEAAMRSGALVTARLALEQGKEVFALPGSVDNELSYGPNDLIKQGAVPVTGIDDIIENLGWSRSSTPEEINRDVSGLTKDELSIYNNLSIQPVHFDDLSRKASIGPSRTAELLLNLEIKGFILRKPGNYVVKS